MHIRYFKLVCINRSNRLQTSATNGLKQRTFSSNLSLGSQELFSNDYRKVSGIDIFCDIQNFVSQCLFKGFVEYRCYTIRR